MPNVVLNNTTYVPCEFSHLRIGDHVLFMSRDVAAVRNTPPAFVNATVARVGVVRDAYVRFEALDRYEGLDLCEFRSLEGLVRDGCTRLRRLSGHTEPVLMMTNFGNRLA